MQAAVSLRILVSILLTIEEFLTYHLKHKKGFLSSYVFNFKRKS